MKLIYRNRKFKLFMQWIIFEKTFRYSIKFQSHMKLIHRPFKLWRFNVPFVKKLFDIQSCCQAAWNWFRDPSNYKELMYILFEQKFLSSQILRSTSFCQNFTFFRPLKKGIFNFTFFSPNFTFFRPLKKGIFFYFTFFSPNFTFLYQLYFFVPILLFYTNFTFFSPTRTFHRIRWKFGGLTFNLLFAGKQVYFVILKIQLEIIIVVSSYLKLNFRR
jgi:hypothetical protein